jgi:hydroxyacylglutathione hydrolase
MEVSRIYMNNDLRNYCYLLICEETREAILLDPLDAKVCLAEAEKKNCQIKKIINTHEHHDHIDGNPEVVAATGAKIHAHQNAVNTIPNVDVALKAGDIVEVGTQVRLKILDTPGHTMAHVCMFSEIGEPLLFCGDTLFNAGAGNCRFGGSPNILYKTFVEQLAVLPDETKVYPGHDYITNNLEFTLAREPGNSYAKTLLDEVEKQDADSRKVTTMAEEKKMNAFLRLDSEEIIVELKKEFSDQQDDPESVFVSLRALRDKW